MRTRAPKKIRVRRRGCLFSVNMGVEVRMTEHYYTGWSQPCSPPNYGCACGKWLKKAALEKHLVDEQRAELQAEAMDVLREAVYDCPVYSGSRS